MKTTMALGDWRKDDYKNLYTAPGWTLFLTENYMEILETFQNKGAKTIADITNDRFAVRNEAN